MQLSGLVLDVYDDQGGEVLRSIYPSSDDIPHLVKTAHALSEEERSGLPDDVFALVLMNGEGSSLRKYACVDPGNTMLAVNFFLETRDKIPAEAQKVAAANLLEACGWYDLEPPEDLLKTAGKKSWTSDVPIVAKAALPLAAGAMVAAPLVSRGIRGVSESSGIVNPNIMKRAEASGTPLMPGQGRTEASKVRPRAVVKKTAGIASKMSEGLGYGSDLMKSVANKEEGALQMAIGAGGGLAAVPAAAATGGYLADKSSGRKEKKASIGHLVQGKVKHPKSETCAMLEQGQGCSAKNPGLRQHKQLTPHVNVQGAEPPTPTTLKTSSVSALPGRYPLDSYEQVKEASAYFDEYWRRFSPRDRREYCVNMVKRANLLRIPVSPIAQKYASATYAPPEEVEFALDTRRSLVGEDLAELLDKLSSARPTVDPEIFAVALEEFDKTAGVLHFYDRDIPDPYYSTFGFVKEAEFSEVIGNDHVNEDQLKVFAQKGLELLEGRFGEDMAKEFQKDPVGIFKSLPMEQKKVIMRLATDPQPV